MTRGEFAEWILEHLEASVKFSITKQMVSIANSHHFGIFTT